MKPAARPLTHRQLEVLELVAKGMTNPEIGALLGLGLSTVKTHVSAVLESLGASNRTEAVGMLGELRSHERDPSKRDVPGFGARPTLALLPLEHVGGASEDAWFAHGLLADLTQRAGGVRWFPVIQPDSVRENELGPETARYRVSGSVVRDDGRIIVTLRGSDSERGENVWATRIERPLDAVAELQQEAIERIVGEFEPAVLRLELLNRERERADRIVVWDLCKRGEFAIGSESLAGYQRGVALFEEATDLDAQSARAWAGLALAHAEAIYLGLVEDLSPLAARARDAATRALDLAPVDFEAHLSLGRTLALSREDDAAIPHLEEAIELDPSSTVAANTLAGALRRRGRFEDAIPYYRRCLRLSPNSAQIHHVHGGLSLAHLSAGDYESALACATLAVDADPNEGSGKTLDFYPVIPASLALLGRIDEAKEAWRRAGVRASAPRMRHSARFTGEGLEALAEGLRLAGWDGELR